MQLITVYHYVCSRRSTIPLCSVISLQWEMVSAAKLSRLPNALEMSMHFSIHHRYYVYRVSLESQKFYCDSYS